MANRTPNAEALVAMFHPEHFPEEFLHAPASGVQRLAAERSDLIDPPSGFSVPLLVRSKIALLLQSVQNGIESARTQLVAVTSQLLCDPDAVQRLLVRMVENVQANQSRIETFIIHIDFRCPISISKFNIDRM